MSVSEQHPEYAKYIDIWQQTRDAVCGSVAIKAGKAKYLPVPDSEEGDNFNHGTDSIRYRKYLQRAIYTNFVGRTKNALVGAAFRRDPIKDLPSGLEYLEDDATGDGTSLTQFAKDQLSDLLETGRSVLLVDYPSVDDGVSLEDMAVRKLQAHIIPYRAEQFINWKTTNIDGKQLLSLAVLKEEYIDDEDEFGHETRAQYRVLRLRGDGYTQQLYRDEKPVSEEVYPKNASGQNWQFIPLVVVGSKNNDSTVDDAPLADIASVNIGHYRNSADYEEGVFITGQPTLFLTHSLSQDQWLEYNPRGIKLGSRQGFVLGESGSANLLQASSNNAAAEAMKQKALDMIAIGARIITDRGQNETAEAARIRFSSENSVLGDVVGNLSEAIELCLYWCAEFMGIAGEPEFEINSEFYDKSLDPTMISALSMLVDRQIITERDVFERVKEAGLIDEERLFDDVIEESEDKNPALDEAMRQVAMMTKQEDADAL